MASAPSSRSKHRKKLPEKDTQAVVMENLTTEPYERRIENLILNNQALSRALETSHQTIQQQDKLISSMQNKLLYSRIPKLVELRLEVMGKMIQQLQDMFEEVKALVNKAPADALNDISPAIVTPIVSALVNENSGLADASPNTTAMKQEALEALSQDSLSQDTALNQQMPLLTIEDDLHKDDGHNSDIHNEEKFAEKVDAPISKSRSSSVKIDKPENTPISDDLMLLPASTSKTNPRLPRKRSSGVSSSKKKHVERCKKPESYRIGSSSDEDSMDSKKRKIKIKFRSSAVPGKGRPVRGNSTSTPSSKGNKNTIKQNNLFNDTKVLKIPENHQKKLPVKIDMSTATSKGSKNALKQNDVFNSTEIVDILNDDQKSEASVLPDAVPSVLDSPEVKFLNISNNVPSSKISSPSIGKKRGPKPKKRAGKRIYEKKKSSKKPKVENVQEVASKTKEVDESTLKINGPEEMKLNCIGVEKEEEKLNGTLGPKFRKTNKTASFTSFLNEETKVKEEDKMNNKMKKPSIPSVTGNRSRSSSVDLVNKQPQVVLMDIFTSQQNSADPIITKSWEEYRASTKLENSVEENNLDKLIPEVEEIQPFDLELECVSDDDPLTLGNGSKSPDISPTKSIGEEEPSESEISANDTNCILGLNETSSVLLPFDSVQFAKDCSEVKQNSVDNSLITLDTIDKLLASVCPEHSYNKEFERDERLVFTYS